MTRAHLRLTVTSDSTEPVNDNVGSVPLPDLADGRVDFHTLRHRLGDLLAGVAEEFHNPTPLFEEEP